jgi:hypothetical protein
MSAEDLAVSVGNGHHLTDLFALTDEAFAEWAEAHKGAKWAQILGPYPPPDVQNGIKSVATLREVFNRHKWLAREGTEWVKTLLQRGQLVCRVCVKSNAKEGVFLATSVSATRHFANSKHLERVEQHDKTLRKIEDVGGVTEAGAAAAKARARAHVALVVGKLVGGGDGAAGIPPTSVPRVFSRDMLRALAAMDNGFPQGAETTTVVVPEAVTLVEGRIKRMVQDLPLVMYIDGGSSKLALGRKVVCVCASSMDLEYDLLMDVLVIDHHETAASQAAQIEALREKLGIAKANVWYLCADNASVNGATVDKLNAMGYNITYARCLPHCLNLLVKAFLDVFDSKYKLASNLRLTRAFLNAGGGVGHKLLAMEFGITASRVDFCDTRWASLLKAILYLVNAQSPKELEKARERLEELAASGDATAAEALDVADDPRLVFNVLYELIESISEDDLKDRVLQTDSVDGSLTKAKQSLRKFYANLDALAGMFVISIVLGGNVEGGADSVPTLMSITQGDPRYACGLASRVTGDVPNATNAARRLLQHLEKLHWRWEGAPAEPAEGDAERIEKQRVWERTMVVKDELLLLLEKQADAVVTVAERDDENLFTPGERYNVDDVERYLEKHKGLCAAIVPKAMEVLQKALAAVHAAAGMEKTEECVRGLERAQRFDVNVAPTKTPHGGLRAFLGCAGLSFGAFSDVEDGWNRHCEDWEEPEEKLKPAEVRLTPLLSHRLSPSAS